MSLTSIIFSLSVAAVVVLFLLALLWKTLGEMATEEMKARLDDVPAKLVALALWRLPAHLRDDYRVEWEDDLLASYEDRNARYPITKLLCAVTFAAPLFWCARGLAREFDKVRRQGLSDEQHERIVSQPANRPYPKRSSATLVKRRWNIEWEEITTDQVYDKNGVVVS